MDGTCGGVTSTMMAMAWVSGEHSIVEVLEWVNLCSPGAWNEDEICAEAKSALS